MPDLYHNLIGHLGYSAFFAVSMAFLSHIVVLVFLVGAEKEMVWINALWVIALVAYVKIRRGAFIRDTIGNSVSAKLLVVCAERAVSPAILSRLPNPASIWTRLINFFEKSSDVALAQIGFSNVSAVEIGHALNRSGVQLVVQ